MKTIYIDSEFRCFATENENTVQNIGTDFFDGKCDAFIEGFRFIPQGETWVREDGVEFHGEMIAPWKPYEQLERAQMAYEKEQYEAAIDELLLLI
ncbi:MAG: hypothetical protein IJ347_01190 [Faecalibacterium sp.]|nr:hypothetical protein [Faecalibacterium sp.]